MSEYICDDRVDMIEFGNKINNMTVEEFEALKSQIATLNESGDASLHKAESAVCY